MAKNSGSELEMLTNLLKDASSNKKHLSTVTTAVNKYIKAQRNALDALETTLLSVGASNKVNGSPVLKDSQGNVLDRRSKEYKEAYKKWAAENVKQ